MRITNVIVMYFVVGAVLFGGGAIDFQESGVATFFVTQDQQGDLKSAEKAETNFSGIGGTITSIVGQFGAPIMLVWNLIVGLLGFSAWPLITMLSNDVPPRVSLLLGGSLTASFYLSVIALVRSSA